MRIAVKVSRRRFVVVDADDWELKLDPPVNVVLPIGRGYLPGLRRVLGF